MGPMLRSRDERAVMNAGADSEHIVDRREHHEVVEQEIVPVVLQLVEEVLVQAVQQDKERENVPPPPSGTYSRWEPVWP